MIVDRWYRALTGRVRFQAEGGFALRLVCLAVGAGCAVYLAVFLRRAWKIWKT